MIERMRFWVQVVEMGFLCKVAGFGFGDKVRSSDIWRELWVALLFCFEKSQLKQFGHLIRMPPGCFPFEVFWAQPTGRGSQGRPRT